MDDDLKARLLKPRLPEAEVDVPGVGTVRVRALTQLEAMRVHQVDGQEAMERRIIALGMVDPPMTEAEVGRWQKAATAGELTEVSLKIGELSGLLSGAAKEVVKSFRGGSNAGVHVLPGAETRHDGGRPDGADVSG